MANLKKQTGGGEREKKNGKKKRKKVIALVFAIAIVMTVFTAVVPVVPTTSNVLINKQDDLTPKVRIWLDYTTLYTYFSGDELWGNVIVRNPSTETQDIRRVIEIRDSIGELKKSWERSGTLRPNQTYYQRGHLYVPPCAPAGTYTLNALLYDVNTGVLLDKDSINFTVLNRITPEDLKKDGYTEVKGDEFEIYYKYEDHKWYKDDHWRYFIHNNNSELMLWAIEIQTNYKVPCHENPKKFLDVKLGGKGVFGWGVQYKKDSNDIVTIRVQAPYASMLAQCQWISIKINDKRKDAKNSKGKARVQWSNTDYSDWVEVDVPAGPS